MGILPACCCVHFRPSHRKALGGRLSTAVMLSSLSTAVAARVHHGEGVLFPAVILPGSVITLSDGNFIFPQLFYGISWLSSIGKRLPFLCSSLNYFFTHSGLRGCYFHVLCYCPFLPRFGGREPVQADFCFSVPIKFLSTSDVLAEKSFSGSVVCSSFRIGRFSKEPCLFSVENDI